MSQDQDIINSILDEMANLAAAKQALESQLQASKAANQALEAANQALEAANQALESQLQASKAANQALESQLQESDAAKTKLARNLEHQIEVTVCLRQKNIKFLGKIKGLESENTILQATQELHKGIISDLKGALLEEQLEKNQFEKMCTNTAELFTANHNPVMFLNTLFCEPFTLEIMPMPVPMPVCMRMPMSMHVSDFYPKEAMLSTRC